MAASMTLASHLKGKCQKLLHSVRFIPGMLHARPVSTNTEAEISDYEIEAQEFERKLAKIRDCSKLNKKEKMRHHGKMPEQKYLETYRGDKRRKLRRLYAEHGSASGISPGIMYPSRAELADMIDVEKNWTLSFQQMQKNLEEKKAAEALAARLRDEKINKAMQKMPQLLKHYHDKQKKQKEDERKKDKTETLLEEFRETHGFAVKPDSSQFKIFKRQKSEELKTLKALQKKEEKKAKSMKGLKKILEEQVKPES